MKHRLLLASLLPLVALAACGGSGDSAASAEIDAAIHAAALVHSPTECEVIATQRFLEQVSGETGVAAFRICEEEAEDPTNRAKSIAVSKVAVDGDQATARVRFAGFPVASPETVVVSLVEEEYGWALDALRGFAPGGRPKSAHSVATYPVLTAKDKGCLDRVAAETSSREYEDGLLAAAFATSRYQDARATCAGTGATEVSPPGASYAFPVPEGFRAAAPTRHDRSFLVFLFAPPTRHIGAGIDVHEHHLSPALGPLADRDNLRAARKGFQDGIQEEERETGATESAVEAIRVHGRPALRWVIANGASVPFPGTNTETTVIFNAAGTNSVWVDCTWGRDQAESRLVQRGCGAVIRSLRLG